MSVLEEIAVEPRQRSARLFAARDWEQRLLGWRSGTGFGRLEAVVFCVYAAVVAFGVRFHEHWSDEAQAWVLARDNSFWDIFRHRLHYEGTPAEWHFLLRAFQLAGGHYGGFGWLGAGCALAGVYALLRWSPFPLLIRVLLPFSFFLLYQYAVVTRSYVLFPLLTWAACALFTARPRRPLAFAVAAGLLANLSMQGMIVSGVLAVLYGRKMWCERRQTRRAGPGWGWSGAMAAGMFALAVYPAIPAPDVNFAVADQVSSGWVHEALVKVVGETAANPAPPRPPAPPPAAKSAEELAADAQAQAEDEAGRVRPSWLQSPRRRMAWESGARPAGPSLYPHLALDFLMSLLPQTTWPVANSNVLACAFLLSWILWMKARGHSALVLPWAGVLLVGNFIWVADHHTGMSLIAILAAVWIAANESEGRRGSLRLERWFPRLFAAVVLLQVAWSGASLWRDVHEPYDPGTQVARLLKSKPAGTRMAAFDFHSMAIQPFFQQNPFFNLPSAFWQWTTHVDPQAWDLQVLAQRPDVVVYSSEAMGFSTMRNQWIPQSRVNVFPRSFLLDDLANAGYHETHRFCGERFARFSTSFRVCDRIFEPAAESGWKAK